MRITADTNLLVRALTRDDPVQARLAETALTDAELVALPLPALCELAWVLGQGYGARREAIAEGMRRLLNGANVAVNRPAVEAGLAMLEAGGDFADGVIAFEGAWLGGEVFLSFDRQAVKLLDGRGELARLLE